MIMQCVKVYKAYTDFDTELAENTKGSEGPKTSFPKNSVANTDFYKPVLNKIMITHE